MEEVGSLNNIFCAYFRLLWLQIYPSKDRNSELIRHRYSDFRKIFIGFEVSYFLGFFSERYWIQGDSHFGDWSKKQKINKSFSFHVLYLLSEFLTTTAMNNIL